MCCGRQKTKEKKSIKHTHTMIMSLWRPRDFYDDTRELDCWWCTQLTILRLLTQSKKEKNKKRVIRRRGPIKYHTNVFIAKKIGSSDKNIPAIKLIIKHNPLKKQKSAEYFSIIMGIGNDDAAALIDNSAHCHVVSRRPPSLSAGVY